MILLLCLWASAAAQEDEATITGTVRLGHRAPKRQKIRLDSEPLAMQVHPNGLLSEELVVDEDNHVRDVLVCITAGFPKRDSPAARSLVLMEFKGFVLQPHVVAVRSGQEFVVRNCDPTLHNAHLLTYTNKERNVGLPSPGDEVKHRFESAEPHIKCKCDVHPWEYGWVHVIDHPFYSITGPNGRFEIGGLPAGRYTLEVWQEECKPVTLEVVVGPGEKKTLEIELETTEPPPPISWQPLAIGAGAALLLGLIAAFLVARRR